MTLETNRLLLRPWRQLDAKSLYEYAKDPRVGPIAGWPAHTSVENSRDIIREVLSAAETYAVTVKGDDTAIGSIGLVIGGNSNLGIPENEGEIGYWIAVPYWGQGYIPEATGELMRHGFEDLGLMAIWCGYFDGNEKSRRVGEKCGFQYVRTEKKHWPLIGETKTQHITRMTREEWIQRKSNNLLQNLERLHTTELGAQRIRKNLDLSVEDVVLWCKQKIRSADDIVRRGKNWYVYVDNATITVNAHSFTIITAHKGIARISIPCNESPEQTYTKEELREALRAIDSTIRKCEKVQPKLEEGTSSHTLLVRRIKALRIAAVLIQRELEQGE